MKIEFVNHASVVLDAGGVRMISDPWLEGPAFNNGWALLSPPVLEYGAFKDITHLWFSHEHPDHFSPRTLKKIPPDDRRNITVLFQETGDRKLVEFCRKQGFKEVKELSSSRWERLAPEVEVLCSPFGGFADSWILFKTPECRVLNVNDCVLNNQEDARRVQRVVGDVDVLLTQFSISAWDGNPEELERRRGGARQMLGRTVMHCEVFAPRYVVPFASYIWFCHEENCYMNEGVLGIDEVEATLRTKTNVTPLIMYPGDEWALGESFPSDLSVERYLKDQKEVATRPRTKAEHVDREQLVEASKKFCRAVAEGSNPLKMRMHLAKATFALKRSLRRRPGSPNVGGAVSSLLGMLTLHVEPARLYLSDHDASYLFDLYHGLRPADLAEEDCEIVLGSESLHYALQFLWGGETLLFNGRFREVFPEGRRALFHYFAMAGDRNAGKFITWRTFPRDLAEKIWRWVGLSASPREVGSIAE